MALRRKLTNAAADGDMLCGSFRELLVLQSVYMSQPKTTDEIEALLKRKEQLDERLRWGWGGRGGSTEQEYVDALAERGCINRSLDNDKAAWADFNSVLRLRPGYAEVRALRGEAYLSLKNYEAALADFNHALRLNPNLIIALGGRGVIFFYYSEYQDALADFNLVLKLKPGDAEARAWRGETYLSLKNYEAALADFDRALQLKPDFHLTDFINKRRQDALVHFEREAQEAGRHLSDSELYSRMVGRWQWYHWTLKGPCGN